MFLDNDRLELRLSTGALFFSIAGATCKQSPHPIFCNTTFYSIEAETGKINIHYDSGTLYIASGRNAQLYDIRTPEDLAACKHLMEILGHWETRQAYYGKREFTP